jgi:hypothetical protein
MEFDTSSSKKPLWFLHKELANVSYSFPDFQFFFWNVKRLVINSVLFSKNAVRMQFKLIFVH